MVTVLGDKFFCSGDGTNNVTRGFTGTTVVGTGECQTRLSSVDDFGTSVIQ